MHWVYIEFLNQVYACLRIRHPHSTAAKKNTSHGNEMLPQDTNYASHKKIMLPTRGSVPRSSRQLDHTKTSWPSQRDTNCCDMDMFPVHHVWPKPSCKVQLKGGEDKADRRRGGKTTSGNGQAWSSQNPRGQWRTDKNGGNWLRSHLLCPNDPRS